MAHTCSYELIGYRPITIEHTLKKGQQENNVERVCVFNPQAPLNHTNPAILRDTWTYLTVYILTQTKKNI